MKGDSQELGAEEAGLEGAEELTVCSDSSGQYTLLGRILLGRRNILGNILLRDFLNLG